MINKPPHVMDIFLQPGEHYFGDKDTRVRTLLGSCVAVTMWHPKLLVGGMCHYMLPKRMKRSGDLDGKYADEALELLITEARNLGTLPKEYHVKLFGGGNMFPRTQNQKISHVGKKNVDVGRELVKHHGLVLHAEHLGGDGHRNVIFDVWNGDVWMKHQIVSACDNCEVAALCQAA